METYSFGEWVGQRRAEQDMTQRELAVKAACALATIKKIEADERRPSRELALLLADALLVPPDWHDQFVECARGLRPVDALARMQPREPRAATASPGIAFIGREAELTYIAGVLAQPDCRLLTLVGPGGVGKTRLALEIMREQGRLFQDGAVFVSLTAVTEAPLIPAAIAQSMGISLNSEAQLFTYLRDQQMLLVLDNCEQLGDAVGWFSELLQQVPGVRLLATSRERLQLSEEWVYTVPELSDTQATNFFRQAAQRTGIKLDIPDSEAVEVCRLVDNLPLAIELAAGWLPIMSCAQIAEHIRRDIDFLAANVRNVPERHRSVRAVFDYSWRLISAAEQNALMRLSVFRAGWTIDESEPVASAALPILRLLLEKSLVRTMGGGRFDLHELTRQYAAGKLRESRQETDTCERHAAAFLALASDLNIRASGPDAVAAFARLDAEMDNFRAALTWSIEAGSVETAMQILHQLFFLWLRRGYWQEGERWCALVLAVANIQDSKWLCLTQIHMSTFLALQGRFAEAGGYRESAVGMTHHLQDVEALMSVYEVEFQAVPDLEQAQTSYEAFVPLVRQWDHHTKISRLAMAHFLFGDRLRFVGRDSEARTLYEQSLTLFHNAGNVDMIAYPIGNLGQIALREGRIQEAAEQFAKSVRISRQIGNRVGIADWVQQLGRAALYLGDVVQAEACFDEALALYAEMGNRRAEPHPLSCLGSIAWLQGDYERAANLLGMALRGYETVFRQIPDIEYGWSKEVLPDFTNCLLGSSLIAVASGLDEHAAVLFSAVQKLQALAQSDLVSPLQPEADRALTALRSRLPESTLDQAWKHGQSLSLGDMITLAANQSSLDH